jgi:predicted RNase H-like nuclease (RuvC/YqgF family)
MAQVSARQQANEQEVEERERNAAMLELWWWAPWIQAQVKKLERFTNRAVGEHDERIEELEEAAERQEGETRRLRYQLEVSRRERKELAAQLAELRQQVRDLLSAQADPSSESESEGEDESTDTDSGEEAE